MGMLQWSHKDGEARNTEGNKKMTRFEKDLKAALNGEEMEVLRRRKAEIEKLTAEGKACKNSFRRLCIAQEVAQLTAEYNSISELF